MAVLLAVAAAPYFQAARFQIDRNVRGDGGCDAAAVSSNPSAIPTSAGTAGKPAYEVEFCEKGPVSTRSSDEFAGLKFSGRRSRGGPFIDESAALVVTLQHLFVRWQV